MEMVYCIIQMDKKRMKAHFWMINSINLENCTMQIPSQWSMSLIIKILLNLILGGNVMKGILPWIIEMDLDYST